MTTRLDVIRRRELAERIIAHLTNEPCTIAQIVVRFRVNEHTLRGMLVDLKDAERVHTYRSSRLTLWGAGPHPGGSTPEERAEFKPKRRVVQTWAPNTVPQFPLLTALFGGSVHG